MLLTVPASFDEEARELTLAPRRRPASSSVTLLEEPQAAFYAWLDAQRRRLAATRRVGDLVLVCDIGGGTTDFSLIAVSERDGELALERVAVGDHILLGGDNMDLALARLLQQRLEGAAAQRLDTWQLHGAVAPVPDRRRRRCSAIVAARAGRSRCSDGLAPRSAARSPIDAVARRCRPSAAGRLLPGGARATRCRPAAPRRPAGARAALRGRPGGDAPPRALPVAQAAATRCDGADPPRAQRPRLSDARALQRRRHEGGGAAGADRGRAERVARGRRVRAAGRTCSMRRTSITRSRAARPTTAWRGADAASASAAARPRSYYIGIESAMPAVPGMPAPLKALCVVPFGMEEGTTRHDRRPRVRPGRRRAGGVPLPELDRAQEPTGRAR